MEVSKTSGSFRIAKLETAAVPRADFLLLTRQKECCAHNPALLKNSALTSYDADKRRRGSTYDDATSTVHPSRKSVSDFVRKRFGERYVMAAIPCDPPGS